MNVLKQLYSTSDYHDKFGMIFNTDCMELMSNIKQEGVFDVTLTDIPYGTSFADRDPRILTQEIINSYESDEHGIIGWMDASGNDVSLKSIGSALVVYSKWQSKVALNFAAANAQIGYRDTNGNDITLATQYFLPNEEVDINKFVKSIYAKGYTTVYFEDGSYAVYAGAANDYYRVVKFNISWVEQGSNKSASVAKIGRSVIMVAVE